MKRLDISQTEMGELLGRKKQPWVSSKLNNLGNKAEDLSDADKYFVEAVINVLNNRDTYKFTYQEITELDLGELAANEINDPTLDVAAWLAFAKERKSGLQHWRTQLMEKDRAQSQSIEQLKSRKKQLKSQVKLLQSQQGKLLLHRRLLGGIVVVLLLMLIGCIFIEPSSDFKCPDDGGAGEIDFPKNFAEVPREIELRGKFCQGNQEGYGWLFLIIRDSAGNVREWPKEVRGDGPGNIQADEEGNWATTILEYGAQKDSLFDLELKMVDAIGHEEIIKWLEKGKATGKYPPFRFSGRAKAYHLDLVPDIKIIQVRPN